jgi:DNA-binding MarR family transcriptional regulator
VAPKEGQKLSRKELIEGVLLAGRRVGHAAALFHAKVAEHLDLGPTDLKALDIVERHGQITPADLAAEIGFTPASVTAVLDRLEAKRLLRRVPHPTDGRRLLVEFDPSAMERMVPLYDELVRALHEMLSNYNERELAFIERVYSETADRQLAAAQNLSRIPAPKPSQPRPARRTGGA